MSDEETVTVDTSETKILTAEYRDGQLQIVEVTPFDKSKETLIVPDQVEDEGKYTMVETDKGLMQLDLLNLTLVRCEDGEESYRLVSGDGSEGLSTDGTVTCVLQSSDDDHDNQESYVMMENDQGSLVLLQPSQSQEQPETKPKPETPPVDKKATPAEILEKAKAMQKAKSILWQLGSPRTGRRGRKRKGELPPPHELLASPSFKLYLYSCKLCTFKCNAVKELTAHKVTAHGPSGKMRAMRGVASLQCARCPYKAATPSMLEKHVESHDNESSSNKDLESADTVSADARLSLDAPELAAADVLVCGACGYESSSRALFRRHLQLHHQARAGGS